MRLSYIIFLALKNLYSHKMRTILTASGVAISVGFVVFLMSFGFGLQRISTNQIANIDALRILDVSITKSKILKINDELVKKLAGFSKIQNVKPQIVSASKIIFNKSEIDGVVYGKDLDYLSMEDIKLSKGRLYKDKSSEIVVSQSVVEQFGSADLLDKEVILDIVIKTDLLDNPDEPKQFKIKAKIVGILNDKSAPFVYMPTNIFKTNGVNNYSGLKVLVESKEDVSQIKLQIESLGYKVSSIKETIDQINQFFGLFQIILVAFGSIAIIIACLGMFNTLTITLIEKTREVGFMKALGNTRSDIYRLFTVEAVIIGCLGSSLGVFGGVALGKVLNSVIYNLAQTTGNQAEQLFFLPIYIPVFVLVASFVISVLTGFYPARRAARISPLDALRYE